MSKIDEIIDDFELLDDWEDRYRYLIELGQNLTPLDEIDYNDANKVRGCVSQVWLKTQIEDGQNGDNPHLLFTGDSDAHIVRGLISVLFAMFSGQTARDILTIDAAQTLRRLALDEHLTPQRSNGLAAMVKRIRHEAAVALQAEQTAEA
jgi:cysteine desulfuration protein SufE